MCIFHFRKYIFKKNGFYTINNEEEYAKSVSELSCQQYQTKKNILTE